MDGLDLTSFYFWGSVLVGGLLLAAISAGFQHFQGENPDPFAVKGLIRDGLLGGIFTAMAWTLIPESMKTVTENFSNSISTATTSVVDTAVKSTDIELQTGPARF